MEVAFTSARGNGETCSICRDPVKSKAKEHLSSGVSHKFCADCIVQWIKKNPICPICTAPVRSWSVRVLPESLKLGYLSVRLGAIVAGNQGLAHLVVPKFGGISQSILANGIGAVVSLVMAKSLISITEIISRSFNQEKNRTKKLCIAIGSGFIGAYGVSVAVDAFNHLKNLPIADTLTSLLKERVSSYSPC